MLAFEGWEVENQPMPWRRRLSWAPALTAILWATEDGAQGSSLGLGSFRGPGESTGTCPHILGWKEVAPSL